MRVYRWTQSTSQMHTFGAGGWWEGATTFPVFPGRTLYELLYYYYNTVLYVIQRRRRYIYRYAKSDKVRGEREERPYNYKCAHWPHTAAGGTSSLYFFKFFFCPISSDGPITDLYGKLKIGVIGWKFDSNDKLDILHFDRYYKTAGGCHGRIWWYWGGGLSPAGSVCGSIP